MAPTIEPPPGEQGNTSGPVIKPASIASSIRKLHDIIFKITLLKTKLAKLATIPIEMLHLVHELALSACSSLQDPHQVPQLDTISEHLATISAHLSIPSVSQPTQTHTYCKVHNFHCCICSSGVSLYYSLSKVGDSKFPLTLSACADCYRVMTTVTTMMTESQFHHQGMVPSMIIHYSVVLHLHYLTPIYFYRANF